MVRPAEIRGVNIRSAGEHGLGIYSIEGWVTHSSVDQASSTSSGGFSAMFVSGASAARAEDLRLYAAGCDHAVEVTGSCRVGGIDVLSDPVNERYSVPTNTIWSRAFFVNFSVGGELVVGPGTFRLPFPYSARIISVKTAVAVAPTGAAVICDVNKNGTTIFTTQANRPSIPATSNLSQIALPDVIELASADYLTVDIDQIGSTLPGEDLTVTVQLEHDG